MVVLKAKVFSPFHTGWKFHRFHRLLHRFHRKSYGRSQEELLPVKSWKVCVQARSRNRSTISTICWAVSSPPQKSPWLSREETSKDMEALFENPNCGCSRWGDCSSIDDFWRRRRPSVRANRPIAPGRGNAAAPLRYRFPRRVRLVLENEVGQNLPPRAGQPSTDSAEWS